MDLKGKVALITGGARIGAGVAKALARQGCRIALTYKHSQGPAQSTVRQIRAKRGKAAGFQVDLTDPQTIPSLISSIIDSFGRLDILINMASTYESIPFSKMTPDDWQRSLDVDLRSAALLSHAAAPRMRAHGAGRIINFSDWTAASHRPRYKNFVPYYVAKSAVMSLTQVLALELAPQILVNAIAPGPILPPADISASEIRKVKQATPLARWGGSDEVIKAVLFLIETDFVTGECLRVDGGRHLL